MILSQKPDKVEIGQHWMRSDGRVVRVDDERYFRGSREVLIVPVARGGRRSWKWDRAVHSDMTYCGRFR